MNILKNRKKNNFFLIYFVTYFYLCGSISKYSWHRDFQNAIKHLYFWNVEYVAEWRIENEYIYGSTYKGFFIYNKLTENILIFEDLHDFDKYLKKVKLIYTMDNCIGVFDYTKGH